MERKKLKQRVVNEGSKDTSSRNSVYLGAVRTSLPRLLILTNEMNKLILPLLFVVILVSCAVASDVSYLLCTFY